MWYHVFMKKTLIALLVSITVVGLQFMIAVPGSKSISIGMDTISRDAAYGFPIYFKQAYSGGITGATSNSFNVVNMLADLLIIFVLVFLVLKFINVRSRKSSGRNKPE